MKARDSPRYLKISPYKKGTRGRSVHACMTFPHSDKKYLIPYTSRCFACVKYLEVSTITSGALQKIAQIANEKRNRNNAGFCRVMGECNRAYIKMIPRTIQGINHTSSTSANAHFQLVSLLSSAFRKMYNNRKAAKVERLIERTCHFLLNSDSGIT